MHSFVKNVLPLLFLICSLFNNKALAATSLDKVKLESSSINQQSYSDITSHECVDSSTVVRHRVIDEYATGTINSYNSQYLSRDCRRETELSNISIYAQDCSLAGTDSTSRDSGENCNEATIDRTNLTLALIGGSVRETVSVTDCTGCSLPPPGGFGTISGESSLTLTIDCQEDKTVKLLYIKAEGFIISEAQPTGMEFSINGFSPISVYPEDVYQDFYKVYVWSGILKWKIPIDKKCGENITITPSVAGGYGLAVISSIRAIDCEVDVDVFPSDVKPKKTGNNITDITISLADSAPQGGLVVDLTVEPIEGSGGHDHNSSRSNHKGEITDNDGNKIDTLFFAEGETEKRAKYKASEIAGEEKIIAEIRGGLTKCEETVKVKVPEFVGLGGGYYSLKTQPSDNKHTSVYNVSSWVRGLFNRIAAIYSQRFPNGEMLVVTDASLAWGGLYDYKNTWNPPHNTHRIGTDIDVRSWNIPEGQQRIDFERIVCDNYGFPKLEFSGQSNEHYHLYFMPYNANIVGLCVRESPEDGGGGSGGDGGGGGGGGDIPT